MTRLERRIAELAEATGQTIYVGAKSYKNPVEWFAGCQRDSRSDLTEGYGPTAESALDALISELREAAEKAESEARRYC